MSLSFSAPGQARRPPWGTAASLAAHAAIGALLLLLVPARPLPPPAEPQSIAIDLIPAAPASSTAAPPAVFAVPRASAVAPLAAAAPPTAAAPAHGQPGDDMIRATKFFATRFLKDPANSKIRRTLSSFAPGEQIVQLCNMEGLEQIRRADPRYDPDVLVSYAMADTTVSGRTLIADGAAFHNGRAWFALRFRCTISADHAGVEDFEFKLGTPIPKSQWASHGLPEQYEDSE